MNQKQNFAVGNAFRRCWRLNTSFFRSCILLMLVVLPPSESVFAQDAFAPLPNNQSSFGQWTPPSSQQDVFRGPREKGQPNIPAGVSFPEVPEAFDSGVRTANFEVPEIDELTGSSSMESTIDSTASLLSNLKNATSEQLSGLATRLKQDQSWTKKFMSLFGTADTSRMLGSLTLVLGIYFAFVWVMRKINPAGNAGLPAEVIEVMGQVPFGPKRNLQLVRLGSKLLLLMNSPEGTQPIGEITDSIEVEYLASLCPGKRKTASRSLAAIQNAATRLANARPAPAPESPPSAAPAPGPATHSNLANILRSLDQAAKQNTAIFEA